jgi:4-hydroxybenzoate polyprenyltransferase
MTSNASLSDQRLPDARPDNWVDRWAPAGLRPWLKLGRFDRPAGIWLLMLPGWQGVALADAILGRLPDLRLLGLIALGSTAMRAAGCAFNDIVDRKMDAKVARTAGRPVASGRIGVVQAWAFLVGLSLIGLCVLLCMNLTAILLGVGSLALVAGYPFMKRITWWPQAWLGLTFNWGALLGYAAVRGTLDWPAGVLYASGIFWTLGYDTIYAVQDIEDDALAGVKSSARRLGADVRKGVTAFYSLTILLLGGLTKFAPQGWPLLAAAALHLIWQASQVKRDDPQGALRLFKSNRDVGLLVFAALAIAGWRRMHP